MVEDFSSVSWEEPPQTESPLNEETPSASPRSPKTSASISNSSQPIAIAAAGTGAADDTQRAVPALVASDTPAKLANPANLVKPSTTKSIAPPVDTAKPTESQPLGETFIHSLVKSPQKEQDGSQNAYISYLIYTESNSPTFQSPIFSVRRRYSDFYFLYNTLYLEFPAAAVPPLADKSRLEYIKGDRFGAEFTLKRASSLNRFLDRISHHPYLKKSAVYLNFLETPDWNSYKRSLSTRHQQQLAQENGVLDGFSDTLLNAFSKVSKPDDGLVEVKERVGKLEDNLIQVERAFAKVLRRQYDLSYELDEFSQQLIKLAGLEHNLENNIIAFANGTHNLSQGVAALREQTDSDYVVSLRDMQNYVLALKSLIKLSEQKQLDLEALIDYLNKAIQEKDNVLAGGRSNFLLNKIEDVRGVDHEAARKERLRKLDIKISGLKQEVESVKETSANFQELAGKEVDVFEHTKQLEMKKTLSTLADGHINFYQNVITQWEALL